MIPTLETGDIVLTAAHGGGLLSRLIQWGSRAWGEPPTRVSHAAVVLGHGPPAAVPIIESAWPRVRVHWLRYYLSAGAPVWVWRCTLLTHEERMRIAATARTRERERYGIGNLLWFAVDAVIAKLLHLKREPALFSRLNLTKPLVCSQLVAWAYQRIGITVSGKLWQATTPDDIDDHVRRRTAAYELVWTNVEE